MKAISANLLRERAPTPALWVFAVVALIVASLMLLWAREQMLSLKLARAAFTEATINQAALHPLNLGSDLLPSYARSAKEMLKERSLAWPQALTALEATVVDGVTPRSFDASAATGVVRVEVVSSSQEKVLLYVEALNAGAGSDGSSLNWGLQQAQAEPTTKLVIATITGRMRLSGVD